MLVAVECSVGAVALRRRGEVLGEYSHTLSTLSSTLYLLSGVSPLWRPFGISLEDFGVSSHMLHDMHCFLSS